MSDARHDEHAVAGYTHGFWKGSQESPTVLTPRRLRPEELEWDPTWISETDSPIFRLPERNLARQHGGWGTSGDDNLQNIPAQTQSSPSTAKSSQASLARSFPHPSMSVPPPTIEFDFRIAILFDAHRLEAIADLASNPVEFAQVVGGSWSGSLGSGKVVAGGLYCGTSSGAGSKKRKVNGLYKLQTDDENDPAILELKTSGTLSGSWNTLESLRQTGGEKPVDPRAYSYRMFINITTTEERYIDNVGSALWVGSGMWTRNELVIDAYRVA